MTLQVPVHPNFRKPLQTYANNPVNTFTFTQQQVVAAPHRVELRAAPPFVQNQLQNVQNQQNPMQNDPPCANFPLQNPVVQPHQAAPQLFHQPPAGK